jgi:hypothetical protein
MFVEVDVEEIGRGKEDWDAGARVSEQVVQGK